MVMLERDRMPPGRRSAGCKSAGLRRAAAWMLALAAFAAAGQAAAHPHVWVTARAQLAFDGDNITAIRHSWTFDPAYSQFATQGLDTNGDGKLDAAELADLATTNVDGLYEFDFFTKAKANGKALTFTKATDSSMEFRDGALTLNFTLPVDPPAPANRALAVELFDPTYFVSFLFAPEADAAAVTGREPACAITITRPEQRVFDDEELSEAFFNALTSASTFGQDFATRAIVACP
ncbi:DUF1007 family protein [Pseudochelatococcus sp. B33]